MPIDAELKHLKGTDAALRLYTSRINLSRSGTHELESRCPFHNENTASFKVKRKPEGWVWSCHGACQRGGDVVSFVAEFDRVPIGEAIKITREAVGAAPSAEYRPRKWHEERELVSNTFKNAAGTEDKIYKTVPLAQYGAYEANLAASPEAKRWLLEQRGVTFETAKKLHLGFFQDVKKGAGKGNEDIADKGWITLPCIEGDQVVSLKFRSIVRKAFTRKSGMKTALFNTSTIDPLEAVYVTEGEFDSAVLEQAGFRAVSLPSAVKTLPPEMKDQLMNADLVIFAGDCDGKVGTEIMQKLWAELQERSYLLLWPDGCKDANETFLKHCNRNIDAFRALVDDLTRTAKSTPMPGIYSLPDAMQSSKRVSLTNRPDRLHLPWKSVDEMAILLPGSVMSISATNTGMGKTVFIFQATVHGARVWDEVVVNYQCELDTDEASNIVAANVLRRDRNFLTQADYAEAGAKLAGVKYYVGNNPNLTRVDQVLDLIEAAIRRLGATVVVLDHIHFICRNEPDEIQAQANAMQRIKKMAQKYKVKFIVVGQPRKADKAGKGKESHISDFKGSETITSDADAVFNIHREFLKNIDPNNPPRDLYDPITQVKRLKARANGVGAAFTKLLYDGCLATFNEITNEAPPPNLPVKNFQSELRP